MDEFAAHFPEIDVVRKVRWVESPPFLTSEGISASIDVSLHLVEQLTDKLVADATAELMCYERRSRLQSTS